MCVLYIVCACEEGPEPGLGWSWGEEGASEGGGRSDLLIRSSAVHSVCQCVESRGGLAWERERERM